MPGKQAGSVVEVMNDAMQNLVTKEYLTAELDRRFGAVDKRFGTVDKRFTEMKSDMDLRFGAVETEFARVREDAAKSHKSLVVIMMGSTLAIIGMQVATLAIILSLLSNAGWRPDAGVSPEKLGMPNEADQTAV